MPRRSTTSRRLVRFDNGRPMRSSIPFDYVDPDLPTLKALREQEGLERLAREASGEFDLIVSVIDYVRQQWDHSWHTPMQHVNALEVLEDVRSGVRGNFCVYFTHVLLQALWSLGIPCRYVHVGVHHWRSHATSECWSNEHRKWVTVDGDFNLHYFRAEPAAPGTGLVRSFVPQNARDVQRAWRSGEMAQILPVQGTWATAFDPDTKLGDYYGGAFGFLADYENVLRGGPPEWEGQRCRWFIWQDKDDGLADYHLHNFRLTHGNGVCTPVSDLEQYYWPLNEVVIEPPDLDRIEGDRLELAFETFTPFFSGFLVRADEGQWRELRADRVEGHRAFGSLSCRLGSRRDVIEVRTRNRAGRLGPVATIEIASPPYVPPECTGRWPAVSGHSNLGGFDVHEGRLHVPQKIPAKIVVIRDGQVEREVGTPIRVPPMPENPPMEPWSETVNLRRAAEAPAGHLLAPQACAVAPDGTLYVGDAENYRVQPFAPGGKPLQPWGAPGEGDTQFLHIRALAVGPDGSVYVADSGYAGSVGLRTGHVSRLRRFAARGEFRGVLAGSGSAPGEVCSPAGLDVDGAGHLWVAESGNHRVQCFSPDGKVLACWGEAGDGWGGLRFPTDVATAPGGCLFVADPQHRCVWKFSGSGEPLARIDRGSDGAVLLRPGRLAIDGERLFVGDVGTGTIHLYRLKGET